jgi:hypothetical protein
MYKNKKNKHEIHQSGFRTYIHRHVCKCKCVSERERERDREGKWDRERKRERVLKCLSRL